MPRIRSQSQSFNLYVSTGAATGTMSGDGDIKQLFRLTSIGGPEWTYEKAPISVIGKLAPITRDTTDSPTVSVPFSYYLTDFENEKNIGLNVTTTGVGGIGMPITGAISDILTNKGGIDEKNYFILVTPQGIDAISRSGIDGTDYILGIGNANITNYSIEASVGDYPKANVTVEGLNLRGQTGTASGLLTALPSLSGWLKTPAIDPTNGLQISGLNTNFRLPAGSVGNPSKPFVLKPGDISVDLSSASGLFADTVLGQFNIQSFNVSFDLARDPIQSLGSRYAKSRELTFPIDVNFTVEALAGDLKVANLRDHVCNTGVYSATVTMRRPDCSNTGAIASVIVLKGLSLQSEAFSVDVDDNQSVSLTWLGSIGSPTDADNNVFLSGVVSY